MTLILASQSASRRAMLDDAGVSYDARPADVNEAAIKAGMVGATPQNIAGALAAAKALTVSIGAPGCTVLGSDSLVVLADGTILDKPRDRADALAHLQALSGGPHRIISAAALARDGEVTWQYVDTADLHVRPLSDAFIAAYLDVEWPAIAGCVGCFRIEGPGVQLFERIVGDHFTVLGMPLIPVLGALRNAGLMAS